MAANFSRSALAVMLVVSVVGVSNAVKCWHSSIGTQTPASPNIQNQLNTANQVYNARAPHGPIVAVNCTKNCYGELYEVGDDWFYQVGCTDLEVTSMEESRGKGMYYKLICNTDWCNTGVANMPSVFILMVLTVVAIFNK